MLAPGANGVARVMVPADSEVLKLPPFSCVGGSSIVVPWTLTVHGVGEGEQVTESLIPDTDTDAEVRARRSAKPEGAGTLVMSTF